jgi:hypothetical protein
MQLIKKSTMKIASCIFLFRRPLKSPMLFILCLLSKVVKKRTKKKSHSFSLNKQIRLKYYKEKKKRINSNDTKCIINFLFF